MKTGDKVKVNATVLRVHGDESTDPAYRFADLQLADGQFVQTNLRNIDAPEAEASTESEKVPAGKKGAAKK